MWKRPSLLEDKQHGEDLTKFIDFAISGLQLSEKKAFDLITGKYHFENTEKLYLKLVFLNYIEISSIEIYDNLFCLVIPHDLIRCIDNQQDSTEQSNVTNSNQGKI